MNVHLERKLYLFSYVYLGVLHEYYVPKHFGSRWHSLHLRFICFVKLFPLPPHPSGSTFVSINCFNLAFRHPALSLQLSDSHSSFASAYPAFSLHLADFAFEHPSSRAQLHSSIRELTISGHGIFPDHDHYVSPVGSPCMFARSSVREFLPLDCLVPLVDF